VAFHRACTPLGGGDKPVSPLERGLRGVLIDKIKSIASIFELNHSTLKISICKGKSVVCQTLNQEYFEV
jgi:hypothetical protein